MWMTGRSLVEGYPNFPALLLYVGQNRAYDTRHSTSQTKTIAPIKCSLNEIGCQGLHQHGSVFNTIQR